MTFTYFPKIGFYFSAVEPTALVQDGGGPCAVLAAVQAVILREVMFTRKLKITELTGRFPLGHWSYFHVA